VAVVREMKADARSPWTRSARESFEETHCVALSPRDEALPSWMARGTVYLRSGRAILATANFRLVNRTEGCSDPRRRGSGRVSGAAGERERLNPGAAERLNRAKASARQAQQPGPQSWQHPHPGVSQLPQLHRSEIMTTSCLKCVIAAFRRGDTCSLKVVVATGSSLIRNEVP
jgi:hypothetical protein